MTESSVIASYTSPHDIWLGSSGSLLPLFHARLISEEGHDIEGYDEPGELLLSSPSIMQGFLGDDAENEATFGSNGWLRTGDVVVVRLSPKQQTEHLFIVDRLKDMIKVKASLLLAFKSRALPTDMCLSRDCKWYRPISKLN